MIESTLLTQVRAALLVAPADVDSNARLPDLADFRPVPREPLPFRSLVVTSDDDPYVSVGRAKWFATAYGLLHISEVAKERIRAVEDVLSEGDEVIVKCIKVDRDGKIRLSRREALDANPGPEEVHNFVI